jgi:hypothetical protein
LRPERSVVAQPSAEVRFLAVFARSYGHLERLVRVDLTRSPFRPGMTGVCAFRPKTEVDVWRSLQTARWKSESGKLRSATNAKVTGW